MEKAGGKKINFENIENILKYIVQTLLLVTFLYFTYNYIQRLQRKSIGLTTTSREPALITFPSVTLCFVKVGYGYITESNDTFTSSYEKLKIDYGVKISRAYMHLYERDE